jgi:hypothetical protein
MAEPEWDTINEGDVILTHMPDGKSTMALQVLNGMLYAIEYPYKPDKNHDRPFGPANAAYVPIQAGLWRKVYDAKTGWRRD